MLTVVAIAIAAAAAERQAAIAYNCIRHGLYLRAQGAVRRQHQQPRPHRMTFSSTIRVTATPSMISHGYQVVEQRGEVSNRLSTAGFRGNQRVLPVQQVGTGKSLPAAACNHSKSTFAMFSIFAVSSLQCALVQTVGLACQAGKLQH